MFLCADQSGYDIKFVANYGRTEQFGILYSLRLISDRTENN